MPSKSIIHKGLAELDKDTFVSKNVLTATDRTTASRLPANETVGDESFSELAERWVMHSLAQYHTHPRRGRPRDETVTRAIELLRQGVSRRAIPEKVIPEYDKLANAEKTYRRWLLWRAVAKREERERKTKLQI
jgi:hypothetical protein